MSKRPTYAYRREGGWGPVRKHAGLSLIEARRLVVWSLADNGHASKTQAVEFVCDMRTDGTPATYPGAPYVFTITREA